MNPRMSSTLPISVGTTTTSYRAVVARHAARIKDAFRFGFSRTTRPQSEYVRSLKKSVLSSERCQAVELVCALVVDLAQRGELEEATSIGEHLIATARVEHASANPATDAPILSRAEAHIAEERAQGEKENAETAMSNFPTLSNKLRFLAADAAYERAAKQFRTAVQREVANQ